MDYCGSSRNHLFTGFVVGVCLAGIATMRAPHGIVLLAHGSRDPLWHRPVQSVARAIQQHAPGLPLECAYIEISQPDLNEAVERLMHAGVEAIRVIPLFLGVGRHAREDIPRLIANLTEQYPQVQFDLRPAVGEDERLIALLAQIALEDFVK